MGIRLPRAKPRNPLLSFIYRLSKLPFASAKAKFKLYLNLEWIFDRLAHEQSFRIYTPLDHPLRIHQRNFILESVEPHFTVLDLGCHTGDISSFIAEKAKKVTGIDHDAEAIEQAKKKYQRDNLEFRHGEARAFLENAPEKYDVLILSHILEHLDDPEEFLNSFKKHFTYIYIEVPDFDRYLLNHYRKDMQLDLIYSDNDHVSEFDRFELRALVTGCGTTIMREAYIYGVQKLWCKVN